MRTQNTTFNTAMEGSGYYLAAAYEFFFSGSTTRIWTGHDTIQLDGNTFYGMGLVGDVSENIEVRDLSAQGRTLSIGASSEYVLQQVQSWKGIYKNRIAKEYIVVFGKDGNYLTHVCTFLGRMDKLDIKAETDKGTIVTLHLENHMIDLARPIIKRYTQEELQVDSGTDDRGFEYVNGIMNTTIQWGTLRFAPSVVYAFKGTYGL